MRTLGLALTLALASAPVAAADLTVRIAGIAPLGGTLRVGLFDSAEAFAARREGVTASRNLAADGPRAAVTFTDLPAGRYAVTAHHDADDDRELDRLFALVPTEGVALSTNPPLVRMPAFDDVAVAVEGDARVTLELVYPLGARVAAGG